MPDNSRLKKALLEIPEEGATVSTLARLWQVSVHTASTWLNQHRGKEVQRFYRFGVRYYKRLPDEQA